VRSSRARHGRNTAGALLGVLLLVAPTLLSIAPAAAAAPTPQAVGQRVAFFEDFTSGTLDPERWVLPTSWVLELTRMRPWDFQGLPLNDTPTPHLSDSPFDQGGRYREQTRTWVETNWIDLSAATSTAQALLFHRYDIDPSEDTAFLMARSESRGWTVIGPVAGYPTLNGFTGSSSVFTGTTFDLSPYVGSRVKLALEIVSGTNGVTGDGWHVQSLQVYYSTTAALPDFVASELQLFDSGGGRIFTGTAGQSIELRLQVNNGGTASPPRVTPVVFYDGSPGTGRLLGRADLLPISAGASGAASVWAVLGPGDHTLTATVDPAGGTDELSRSNNAAETQITLEPPSGVDLVPLEFTIEASGISTTGARPGDPLIANITVSNLGSAGVATPYTVGLFLRQGPNTTVLLQDKSSVVGIGAGESVTVPIAFNAVAGDLTLVAVVDTQGAVAELSEANNELERTFPVSDSPGVDLQLEGTEILRAGAPSSEAVEGELLQITTRVRNAGTTDLRESFTVAAYLGDPDAGGEVVYSRRIAGGLIANQSVEVAGSWVSLIGVRTLYVYADVGREIFESSELNNKDSDSVSVRADNRVNLVVTDVAFTVFGTEVQETQVGAPVEIIVTVANHGVETDVDGFLSLSPENPWVYPGTTPLETQRLPLVIPRSGEAAVTFPWRAVSGSHVFFFVADYAFTVSETNEFDNLAVRTLEVSTDSPDLAVGGVSVRSRNIEVGTLYPQLNVTIRCEVTNAGIKMVDQAFTVEVWAGQPGELGSVRLREETVPAPFFVGDSVQVEVQWLAGFPSGGQHAIVVVADPDGTIVEGDRTNNIGQKDVTYAASAKPNLQVESAAVYRGGALVIETEEGEEIEVRLVVVNTSPVPFSHSTVVEVSDGSSTVFSAPITWMEPGDRIEFAFNWTATSGTRLRVTVNILGEVQESDFSDNGLDVQVLVSKVVETPWTLYGAAGGGAAALVLVALLLLVRRRRGRSQADDEEEEGAGGEAAAEKELLPDEHGEEASEGPGDDEGEAGAPAGESAEPQEPEAPPAGSEGVEKVDEVTEAEEAEEAPGPTACPKCGEPVEADWQLCPSCETPLG
jgi:subtilase family serine protease